MSDLGVIIVSWNTRELTLQTLQSLYADLATVALSVRVLVVDNASDDGSVKAVQAQFPQAEVLTSDVNLGFGGANNLGMRYFGFGKAEATALPKAVYLLNSDTVTQPGATEALYQALFSAPDIGLVGAHLTYGDGSFQDGAFSFPGLRQMWAEFFWIPGRLRLGRFNGRYPEEAYASGEPFDVDFTLGATMMLRQDVIRQTGMFDSETFFMYCEEIDWAWRIKRAGWRVLCVPRAHVVHLAGQSTKQVKPRSVINLWESRLKLMDKYYPAWKRWLGRWLVAVGMRYKLQQLLSQPANQERDAVQAAYEQVIALAEGRSSDA